MTTFQSSPLLVHGTLSGENPIDLAFSHDTKGGHRDDTAITFEQPVVDAEARDGDIMVAYDPMTGNYYEVLD